MTTTYPTHSQITFVIDWFKTWSEFQKEDFISNLAHKLKAEEGNEGNVDTVINGMKGLGTEEGRPLSLFQCQVKLFNEWWTSWSPSDREKVTSMFKQVDPSFYSSVEKEMEGTRDKLNEDFMKVPETDEEGMSKEEAGVNGTTNGVHTDKEKIPTPVFTVTKVVINSGISSFTNFSTNDKDEDRAVTDKGEQQDAKNNGSLELSEKEQVEEEVKETESPEPVATEV